MAKLTQPCPYCFGRGFKLTEPLVPGNGDTAGRYKVMCGGCFGTGRAALRETSGGTDAP